MTDTPMPLPAVTQAPTSVPPAVLLANHLKALKLPTFLREYEKIALEAAQDRADYPRYQLRLCELERIDRERRMVERRIRMAKFPRTKSWEPPLTSAANSQRVDRRERHRTKSRTNQNQTAQILA